MHAILGLGVSPKWLETAASKGYETGTRNKTSNIAELAQQMMEDFKSFQDTTFEIMPLDPDDAANWDKFVSLLRSRKWDAISIGGGARTIPQLSDYFTDMVHLASKEQPQAVLLFPLLPSDVVPNVRKYVPEAK